MPAWGTPLHGKGPVGRVLLHISCPLRTNAATRISRPDPKSSQCRSQSCGQHLPSQAAQGKMTAVHPCTGLRPSSGECLPLVTGLTCTAASASTVQSCPHSIDREPEDQRHEVRENREDSRQSPLPCTLHASDASQGGRYHLTEEMRSGWHSYGHTEPWLRELPVIHKAQTARVSTVFLWDFLLVPGGIVLC